MMLGKIMDTIYSILQYSYHLHQGLCQQQLLRLGCCISDSIAEATKLCLIIQTKELTTQQLRSTEVNKVSQ